MPTLTYTPFDEVLQKFFELSREYASKRGRKLAQLPREAIKKILNEFKQKSDWASTNVDALYQKVHRLCREIIKGPHISLEVESFKIRAAMHAKSKLIEGKVKFKRPGERTCLEVSCYVACGHWHKLGELKESKINLIDHLEKLLPPFRKADSQGLIGLVTFQNGIMNTFEGEFKRMSQAIVDQFPEGPLCIGLHNPTTNAILGDLCRFKNEPEMNERSVYSLCQMIKTFADRLPKINPNLIWAHFAHSEGGLIANVALTLCSQSWLKETMKYIKGHLITATYGAVQPIPNESVLTALNTYSSKDVVLLLSKKYLDRDLDKIVQMPYNSTKIYDGKTYSATVVESKLPDSPVLKTLLEPPSAMTVEQRCQMTLVEKLAHTLSLNGSTYLACAFDKTIVDTVNHTNTAINDHFFGEVTYQEVLKKNISDLKRDYGVYDAKRFY